MAALPAFLLLIFLIFGGCGKKGEPVDEVVIISPHNENIRYEFAAGFEKWHQEKYGIPVHLQWRDVGGGSSSILSFLRNVYSHSDTAGIDVVFGGGEYTFQKLKAEGLLVPLQLSDDTKDNIPQTFSGMELRDEEQLWCGNVLSSFGFLYNKQLLDMLNIAPPREWSDLGESEFYDLIVLADPTQSGSVAATYEMIVQSAPDWPSGWAKLLLILSNAKKFTDSSGAAANAPVLGEAPAATCIDFYGTMRVAKNPDKLGYISPKGETGFTPDPIGILKNGPNPELAQHFVEFVLSMPGQCLWALPPAHADGPQRYNLNRPPIRKDFYEKYAGQMSELVVHPYEIGAGMIVDSQLREKRFGVLVKLVQAAAIDNTSLMQQAKKKLIETNFDPAMVAEFSRLPTNVETLEDIEIVSSQIRDAAEAEKIVSEWVRFFGDKYKKIIQ